MPLIPTNFDEIADEIKPIPAGQYTLNIIKAEIEPTKNDPNKDKLVLVLEVDSGPQQGRKCYEHIGISNDYGLTTVKQICKAAGLHPGADGIDTTDLVGLSLKARVKNGTYKAADGEVRENSSIAQYLWKDEDLED